MASSADFHSVDVNAGRAYVDSPAVARLDVHLAEGIPEAYDARTGIDFRRRERRRSEIKRSLRVVAMQDIPVASENGN